MDDVTYSFGDFPRNGFFVTLDGSVWDVWVYIYPYSSTVYLMNLMGDGETTLSTTEFKDVIATENSLWVFNPGDIKSVSSDTQVEAGNYYFENAYVSALRSTIDGGILYSPGWPISPSSVSGPLKTVDDSGTPQFEDDEWNTFAKIERLKAWDISHDGSVWYLANQMYGPAIYEQSTMPPVQLFGETTIQYPDTWPVYRPKYIRVFIVVNERTVLIAFYPGRILRLNNSGTPSDFSDDRWERFDLPEGVLVRDLAQDTLGRIWVLDNENVLYNFTADGWSQVLENVVDSTLAPTANGALFVISQGDAITLIHGDGRIEAVDITDLVSENPDLVRTAKTANSRWSVGVDGTIWFSRHLESEAPEIVRRSPADWTVYPLPSSFVGVEIAVDRYDHVWLLHDATLWRFSALPDYAISFAPKQMLAEPSGTVHGTLTIEASEGFSETVALQIVPSDLDLCSIRQMLLWANRSVSPYVRLIPWVNIMRIYLRIQVCGDFLRIHRVPSSIYRRSTCLAYRS